MWQMSPVVTAARTLPERNPVISMGIVMLPRCEDKPLLVAILGVASGNFSAVGNTSSVAE